MPVRIGRGPAVITFAVFAGLLLGLPLLAAASGSHAVALADSFYRAGALVFGGGHVVLPLLEAETVARGVAERGCFPCRLWRGTGGARTAVHLCGLPWRGG